MDVVFRAIQPADLAGAVQVRGDAAVHPSPLVVDGNADAFIFDVLALLRAANDRPQKRGHVGGHHLVRRLAVDLVLRPANPVGERLVDEGVAQRAVEIGDRPRNVVREEPQLRFLGFQRLADPDVVLDVVDDDERAAGPASRFAVGKQCDPHPAQIAGRRPLSPVVADGRAGYTP